MGERGEEGEGREREGGKKREDQEKGGTGTKSEENAREHAERSNCRHRREQ
jgi:hypothetical protein